MGVPAADGTRRIRPWNFVEALVAWFVATYRRKKLFLLALAFALLILLSFLGNVEQVLRDLHPVGGERSSTASLAGDLLSGPSDERFREVLTTWSDSAQEQDAGLRRVLAWYGAADLALVLVYTLFAGMLLVMLKKELGPPAGPDPDEVADVTGTEDLTPYKRPVSIAIGALGFLLLVDLLETALIFLTARVYENHDWDSLLSTLFWFAFRAKAVLLLLVLVPGIVAVLTFLAKRPERRKGIWPAIAVARGQLLVLAILFVGLFVSNQAVDTLRRWYEDPKDGLFAILMLGWLAVFMLVSTVGLLDTAGRRRSGTATEGTFLAAGLVVAIVGALSLSVFRGGIGILTLAGVLFGLGILSLLVESVPSSGRERELRHAERWLPLTLGLLVLFLPILALVGAAAAPLVLGDLRFLWLLAFAMIMVGVGLLLVWWNETFVGRWRRRASRRGFFALTLLLVAIVAVSLVAEPWQTSGVLGAVAFLAAFLLGFALILYLLIRRAEEARPPDIVALVRFRCTPVLLLLVVWVAATSAIDRETAYHDVRTVSASEAVRAGRSEPVYPKGAFAIWRGSEPSSGEARPLLFVAAAGGGIRAAYWTATVLTCVLEGQAPPEELEAQVACSKGGTPADDRGVASLFAASGISGGSLGLASYATHLTSDRDNPQWPRCRLRDDYAATIVSWGLFVDLPSALFRRAGGSDRAEIVERALERTWLDGPPDDEACGEPIPAADEASPLENGLLHGWRRSSDPRLPILMLNGTKVQEGCRLNGSVLDTSVEPIRSVEDTSVESPDKETIVEDCLSLRLFERDPLDPERERALKAERTKWSLASSDDLLTYLCRAQDVRLSTAAVLSARFPGALPSGRLTRCQEGEAGEDEPTYANIVDGGYFDTSGASPLVELWSAISGAVSVANRNGACIVPYFLQIDTGYADPVKRGDLSPSELLVPLATVMRARDAREHNARQAAALLFTGAPETAAPPTPSAPPDPTLEIDRYAHIYPRAHAGVRAPLGLTLSQVARTELEQQLIRNKDEIEKVRDWLADERRCP